MPTASGKTLLGDVVESPPYYGATPHFSVTEQLEDRDLVQQLFLVTADALPAPKLKKRRS